MASVTDYTKYIIGEVTRYYHNQVIDHKLQMPVPTITRATHSGSGITTLNIDCALPEKEWSKPEVIISRNGLKVCIVPPNGRWSTVNIAAFETPVTDESFIVIRATNTTSGTIGETILHDSLQ